MTTKTDFTTLIFCLFCSCLVAQTSVKGNFTTLVTEDVAPSVVNIPFELVDGLIFVNAIMGGESANFVFDTGAPDLIVNSTFQTDADTLQGLGVGGGISFQNIYIDDFNIGGICKNKFTAYSVDMSHLEELTNRDIKGLIGYAFIKDYELFIDYNNWVITLYKPNAADMIKTVEPIAAIPFVMYNHFPVIQVTIGDQVFNLGLDSGAEVNLIDIEMQGLINEKLMKNKTNIDLYGVDKTSQRVVSAIVKNSNSNGENFKNMEYLFADISHLNDTENRIMDGLLGFPFLSSRTLSINFKDQMVYIWDEMPEALVSAGRK